MSGQRILVVEDNPSTLKMLRVVLAGEGFAVTEAHDARTALEAAIRVKPELVLQDLILPDMSGFELVRQLRALPGGAEIPILAISGFVGLNAQANSADAGFTGLIVKPVEPVRLVEAVRAYLPPPRDTLRPPPKQRLLLVDDDLVQLKLAKRYLSDQGFEVRTAASALEALSAARIVLPEAILSDVMMPEMDGFELCLELRRDPRLQRIPVVLLSAQYRTELDQSLAHRVGANALVARTPDFSSAIAALLAALDSEVPSLSEKPSVEVKLEHSNVVNRQLERQLAIGSGLAQRCTFQAAQLSLLGGVADALAKNADPNQATRDVLAAVLDAAGISKGALLLKGPEDVLSLRHTIGFSDAEAAALPSLFGHRSLLEGTVERRASVSIPSRLLETSVSQEVLSGAGAASVHIVGLASEGRGVGAIVLAAQRTDVTSEDAVAFARAMGNQMVQSLELTNAFARIAASEARYRTLLASASDAIAVLTPEGIIREVNRRWEEILSRPAGELVGKHLRDFAADPREGIWMAAEAPAVPLESRRAEPVEVRRVDGSSVLLEFSYTSLELAGEKLIFAIARDVTAQVQAQERLMVSDRMASVGSLTAAVAHEINNPLSAVALNLELAANSLAALASDREELAAIREDVSEARIAADRVRNIVRDLRIFSRAEKDERKPVNLQRVLESSLRIASNEIRHRALVVRDYAEVPLALANESRLSQVFLNLLVNAAQAIPEGNADANEIRVRTRSDSATEVVAEVSDTGSGMSADVLGKLFRPFFTTKSAATGTGLGLAICHRIIVDLGGEITVESQPGRGTTFRVTLPATDAEPLQTLPPRPTAPAARRGRILVVDDEEPVATTTARALGSEHAVSVLTSASDVLTRIAAGERFDVILCDLMMPRMSGMELYARVLSVDPEQAARMIFLTGGAFTPSTRAFLDQVPNPRLEKPFNLEELRSIVNRSIR